MGMGVRVGDLESRGLASLRWSVCTQPRVLAHLGCACPSPSPLTPYALVLRKLGLWRTCQCPRRAQRNRMEGVSLAAKANEETLRVKSRYMRSPWPPSISPVSPPWWQRYCGQHLIWG